MWLCGRELYDLFIEKGVNSLYHANTVSTAISYFESGGLLSRGDVERRGLFQTPQSSDDKDVKFDVWDDIFLDTLDLHGYFPRQNLYGPVLFVLDPALLLDDGFDVCVTKNNPIYWDDGSSIEERYFQTVSQLRYNWDLADLHRRMTTIRKPGGALSFDYLKKVVVDNPGLIMDECDLLQEAIASISGAKLAGGLDSKPLVTRKCSCYCKYNYKDFSKFELRRLFSPGQNF